MSIDLANLRKAQSAIILPTKVEGRFVVDGFGDVVATCADPDSAVYLALLLNAGPVLLDAAEHEASETLRVLRAGLQKASRDDG